MLRNLRLQNIVIYLLLTSEGLFWYTSVDYSISLNSIEEYNVGKIVAEVARR